MFPHESIGGLKCYIKKNNPSPQTPTVVLLHGYGANGQDLAPLATVFPEFNKYNWLFPEAPISLTEVPGGKAWFTILISALQNASPGKPVKIETPEGMKEARAKLDPFLDELNKQECPYILGGFSQGSMMAADAVLRQKLKQCPKLVLFSTAPICQDEWPQQYKELKTQKVFQSHGTQDPLLDFTAAKEFGETIKPHCRHYEFHAFPGGHGIAPDILKAMKDFLGK